MIFKLEEIRMKMRDYNQKIQFLLFARSLLPPPVLAAPSQAPTAVPRAVGEGGGDSLGIGIASYTGQEQLMKLVA